MIERWTDVLVLGSGIAGLSYALEVAGLGQVTVVTKKDDLASNTNYAQGGIAAVVGEDDDPELHIRDTLEAGGGLARRDRVVRMVEDGPARIAQLLEWGVRFSQGEGGLALGMEGGHSRRRIVHAQDLTGREIERALLRALRELPHAELLEDHFVADLLVVDSADGPRCAGALVFNRFSGQLEAWWSRVTLLATGGGGWVYIRTTNPPIATGDGQAMAYRAGLPMVDIEFVQFHPTALYPGTEQAFLLSETLRGEGAVLRLKNGRAFMVDYHPRGDLAPRDVVARAAVQEMTVAGEEYVLLDLSPLSKDRLEARFPQVLAGCRERGIDPVAEPIPVVPAAHYLCGGVPIDEVGRTGMTGLLAAGEVAWSGVHGANRLASNSLLEAVVFSHRSALYTREAWEGLGRPTGSLRELEHLPGTEEGPEVETALAQVEDRLRRAMWEGAGIVRSQEGLEAVGAELAELSKLWDSLHPSGEAWVRWREVGNLLTLSMTIVAAAQWRCESRGLHYRLDYPEPDDARFGMSSWIAPARDQASVVAGLEDAVGG